MHPQNRPSTEPRAGFTLLELIGVMAVIAILSAAVLPGAIDLIRTQRAVKEGAELPKIAEALKRGMLREQVFPIYENDADELTAGNDAYWWNLAARHGGGSANEARYPLGIRPGSATTRKLYFAETSWSEKSFSEVTDDGLIWLNNFQDPTELRLLLISTTNPDLLLPDTLNEQRFNRFWDDWAVGSDGNPASDRWSRYGLSSSEWQGRAAELNVQRIDLRDWLCTVVIENRRAIAEASGTDLSSALTAALGFWDRGSVSVSSVNLQDAEFIIQARDTTEDLNENNNLDAGEDANGNGFLDSGEDLDGDGSFDVFLDETVNNIDYNRNNVIEVAPYPEDLDGDGFFDHPAQIYTFVEAVINARRGRRIGVTQAATVTISGRRSFLSPPDRSITATLSLTNRAPLALLNPDVPSAPIILTGWTNADPYVQNRYFLKTQELLLGEPWTSAEVGIFSITEAFSTLRFDGLQWHY
jgi:prepilin-type N-terminal cleavage/methylation domain-containing protein